MSAKDESEDILVKLIETNKTEEVVEFLKSAASESVKICNSIAKKGFSPLQCAVFCSHSEIVSTLLTVNADINLPLTTTVRRGVDWYEEGSTALHIACSRRHHDIVQALLKSGAAPDVVNRGAGEQSPLHVAAEHGYLSHVQMLIEAGSDIGRKDQSEELAIHKATRGGHNPVVMFLLTNGSDVNSANKEGFTPLMLSITEGHLKTTIILLENGATITCSDIEQNNPLSLAILNSQEDIIPLLLDNEVNTNAQNSRGYSALHLACQLNQYNTVSLLLDVGVDLDLQNQEGQTALHIAALSNNHNIISQLISAGVKRDIKDIEGRLAAECTNQPNLAAVIEKGYESPKPPIRERTILDMIPEDTNPNNTPVTDHSPTTLQPLKPSTLEIEGQNQNDNSNIIPLSPRAPLSPRNLTSQSSRRQNKLKPRRNNPHTTELHPVGVSRENQPSHPGQFHQPIGVDKATVDTLKQKVQSLESMILTLGLGDDKAVVLYRQYGKLNEEIALARSMVREYIQQNARPLTPRMENNNQSKTSSNYGQSDLPTPRQGAATPSRETRQSNTNGRKFNPNFMVETVESLKSELQILRNSVKPTHVQKLNVYIEQVESMALAVVTFAHLMAVTLLI